MSDIDQLNELFRELSTTADDTIPCSLSTWKNPRFYLSGAMPRDYRTRLAMARKQLKSIDNDGIRARVDHFTREQLHDS